tara:strand:+ start:455 stop:850 length:396 start_codon:yes stop_codon:yes gene_type:complete
MKNINDYIELAKKSTGAKSDRALCKLLEVAPTTIAFYKRGVLPTDETMFKLARLAQVDPEEALMHLNIWRAPAPAKDVYLCLAKKLMMLCLPALFIAVTLAPSGSQAAKNFPEPKHESSREYILSHYFIVL